MRAAAESTVRSTSEYLLMVWPSTGTYVRTSLLPISSSGTETRWAPLRLTGNAGRLWGGIRWDATYLIGVAKFRTPLDLNVPPAGAAAWDYA